MFWGTTQAILGLLYFSLLWLRNDTLIIPLLGVFFYPFFSLFFFYPKNYSTGILICRIWFNLNKNPYFTYATENSLRITCDADCISWESMCTFHLFFCHNVFFFVSEKVSRYSHFFWIIVSLITSLTLCHVNFPTSMTSQR